MKNTFKKTGFTAVAAVICLTALLITGCPPDDGNNEKKEDDKFKNTADFDMKGTYTFTNNDIVCTWGFSSDNYECFGGRINGTKTGVWKTKGNDVTFTFNVDSLVVSPETFTVQTDNNKIILTLKNADISNLFILFGFTTPIKSLTLTKINNKYSPINIEMVNIPSGQFRMGSDSSEGGTNEAGYLNYAIPNNEIPKHNVIISKPFKMGKYEITQEQYQFVMGNNPSYFESDSDAGEIQERRPVENISWCEAVIFCNKLSIIKGLTPAYSINGKTNPIDWGIPPYNDGYNIIGNIELWNSVIIVEGSTGYRLPTEAQWEYACRAGNQSLFNIGNVTKFDKNGNTVIPDNIGWYTNYDENIINKKTHEVGKKLPNAWGLYDMHGNVYEMCWDRYADNYYTSSSVIDPLGASSGEYRISRSGSYNSYILSIRSAYRGYISIDLKHKERGFRIILPL
jgi:formylglycine-generating enzyme